MALGFDSDHIATPRFRGNRAQIRGYVQPIGAVFTVFVMREGASGWNARRRVPCQVWGPLSITTSGQGQVKRQENAHLVKVAFGKHPLIHEYRQELHELPRKRHILRSGKLRRMLPNVSPSADRWVVVRMRVAVTVVSVHVFDSTEAGNRRQFFAYSVTRPIFAAERLVPRTTVLDEPDTILQ